MHALLLVGANPHQLDERTTLQWAEVKGQPTTAQLFRQHAASPPPATASPAAPPDAGEPVGSSPASLPAGLFYSTGRGELQQVVKWLDKWLGTGGSVDALYSIPTPDGQTAASALLHVAATNGHLEIVRMLLKRGASIDLPTNLGGTALMDAAYSGYLSVVIVLLQHSANPDLQDSDGITALAFAASRGQEACVQVLLQRKASTELRDGNGRTALWWAEATGQTATAELIRQHTAPPHPAPGKPAVPVSSPAQLPAKIFHLAERGELQKVVKWLRKGGPVDALYSATARATRGLGQQPQIDLLDRYNIPSLDR